jgi:hypothetical protein
MTEAGTPLFLIENDGQGERVKEEMKESVL